MTCRGSRSSLSDTQESARTRAALLGYDELARKLVKLEWRIRYLIAIAFFLGVLAGIQLERIL